MSLEGVLDEVFGTMQLRGMHVERLRCERRHFGDSRICRFSFSQDLKGQVKTGCKNG